MHQRLGHRYIRSLLDGYTENVWQDIELRVETDPFCTSCQISTINKKARSKTPLKYRTHFRWLFMDIIPVTYSTSLTKDTNFDNKLLIVDAYSKISIIYVVGNITTEEVM